MKLSLTALPLILTLAASSAIAGPVKDFETEFRAAYGSYRMALFATNQGDANKSTAAIGEFETRWSDLVSNNGDTPPPHYADDPAWGETLSDVSETIGKAKQLAGDGKLAESHEVLEHVRDAIGELHARNSIMLFSDRMNAYHAAMEHVLGMPAMQASIQDYVEQAAVLAYLADDMLKAPPPEARDNPEFGKLADAVTASAAAFQAAARSGDAEAVKAAVSGLKVPYSKLFLKFG